MSSSGIVLEKDIERRVVDFARRRGMKVIKLQGLGNRGKLDRVFFPARPHYPFFVEFKAPGKKPTQLQLFEMRELEALGYECHVIDSVEDGYELVKSYET